LNLINDERERKHTLDRGREESELAIEDVMEDLGEEELFVVLGFVWVYMNLKRSVVW